MKSTLYLILAPMFWGLNFHLAKIVLHESSFFEAGFWRYAFGVFALVLVLFWRELPSLTVFRENLKGLLLVGFIGLFGFNILFFLGLQYSEPVNASLIVSLNPVTTSVLSYFILKTVILKRQLIGLAIALVGVAYLLTQGDLSAISELRFNKGDLLIFGANFVFALHHVWVKKYAVDISNFHFTLFTNLICFIGFLMILPFIEFSPVSGHSSGFWQAAFGLGVFGTTIAYLFWNSGVKAVGSDKAGIFMNIVPLSAALTSIFFYQQLHLYHFISGTIIILGLLFTQGAVSFKKTTKQG